MANSLNLKCSLSSPILPASGQPRLVYLLLEVQGGEAVHSLPSNLGLAIDCSDSMRIRLVTDEQFARLVEGGQAQEVLTDGVPAWQINAVSPELIGRLPRKIDFVAEALVATSELLRPEDRFSLVAFAQKAQVLVPTTGGEQAGKLRQAVVELDRLDLGDETRMDRGLQLSLEQLGQASDAVSAGRVILLTDGHTLNVKECYGWAEKARQMGIAVTTMGLGSEFNEELLIPLADMTGGHPYYIESPDQIPPAFRQELGVALRLAYRNMEIKLRFPSGVELRRAHRVLPELGTFDAGPNMQGSYALLLGNHDPAVPTALLLEMVLPAWKAGTYRLAQAVLAWNGPAGEPDRQIQRQEVLVQLIATGAATQDPHVMNIVEKVGAFRMGTQALKAAAEGSRDHATVSLRQAATRLLDMGEATLGALMLEQAEALEQGGKIDPSATKKLRYETRRLTQQLD